MKPLKHDCVALCALCAMFAAALVMFTILCGALVDVVVQLIT